MLHVKRTEQCCGKNITYCWLSYVFDALCFAVCDEVVVEHYIGLKAHNLSPHGLQEQGWAAIGEVIAEQLQVLIVLWL